MSEILFDQLGIDGVGSYQPGDWRKIAVHTATEIRGFFGDYRWLSNFHVCAVTFEGMTYPSSENAYQAAKLIPEARPVFSKCSPRESKQLWKSLPRIPQNWDAVKLGVMQQILRSKFGDNPHLKEKLLASRERYLEETLWWRDTFWGYDVNLKSGENHLGKLLMKLRTELAIPDAT